MHWVIGDIHGMLRPLQALSAAVIRRDPAAHLIFAGDYVNRGPDSRGVIDLLLTLPHATFLRGNHDDIFDLLINDQCYICHSNAPEQLSAFTWFMPHGLGETFISYGADAAELEHLMRRPDPGKIQALSQFVPVPHRQFIRRLRPVFETEDFFVAHGFWHPDEHDDSPAIAARLAADPQLRHTLLWGRFTESQIARRKRWRRTGYFGHTPVNNYKAGADFRTVHGPNIVLLDTAVVLSVSGVLSAVCPETGTTFYANRGGKITEAP